MDAVKFLKEKERMCNSYLGCDSCPVAVTLGRTCKHTLDENYGELVVWIVENWSEEHSEEIGKKYIIEIDKVEHDCDNKIYHIKNGPWVSEETIAKLEEYKESEGK